MSNAKMSSSNNNNSNNSNNSNKKYIPPNKKHPATVTSNMSPAVATKKKTPQKEFSLAAEADAFPCLSASNNNNSSQPVKSFANATKTEIKKAINVISNIKPGWVHIRKHNRTIQFKNGPPSDRNPFPCNIPDDRYSEMLVKHRLAKEQYDRDRDVERLGDLSEYYGEKTVREQFEDNERLIHEIDEDSGSDNDIIDQ